jgi:hypothetical protein
MPWVRREHCGEGVRRRGARGKPVVAARRYRTGQVSAGQAGHCRAQPVSDTAGEVLSPATI